MNIAKYNVILSISMMYEIFYHLIEKITFAYYLKV